MLYPLALFCCLLIVACIPYKIAMSDRPWVYGDPIRRDGGVLYRGWLANHSGLSTGCGGVRPGEAPRDCLRLHHDSVRRVSGRGGDNGPSRGGGVRLLM